jgi:hypothetical protein
MISLIISSTTDPRCLKPLSTILVDLLLNETYYVENIKSTNLNLGTNTKSTNIRIHELVIFNQTTKIDTHEEKYFHSISFILWLSDLLVEETGLPGENHQPVASY